ncbi:hypothetical protein GCM10027082_47260 [Comamonas humi]
MSSFSSLVPNWDTSSLGYPDRTSRIEPLMLGKHLAPCCTLQGPLQVTRAGISRLHHMLAERALTGTLLTTLIAGTVWLVL